jgi:hypothetical protein
MVIKSIGLSLLKEIARFLFEGGPLSIKGVLGLKNGQKGIYTEGSFFYLCCLLENMQRLEKHQNLYTFV